jgi:hypothetical protein
MAVQKEKEKVSSSERSRRREAVRRKRGNGNRDERVEGRTRVTTSLNKSKNEASRRSLVGALEVRRKRDEGRDEVASGLPERERPLYVETALRVGDDADALGEGVEGEGVDSPGDVLGAHLSVGEGATGEVD